MIIKLRISLLIAIALLILGLLCIYIPNQQQYSKAGYSELHIRIKPYWFNTPSANALVNVNGYVNAESSSYKSSDGNSYSGNFGSITLKVTKTSGNDIDGGGTITYTDTKSQKEKSIGNKGWSGSAFLNITISVSPTSGFAVYKPYCAHLKRDEDKAIPSSLRITQSEFSSICASYSQYSTSYELYHALAWSHSNNFMNVYVIFYPKSYTIRFYENGGDWGTSSTYKTTTTVFYEDYNIVSGNPTRTGYTFDGWYTSSSGGSKVTSSTAFTNTSNTYLYAHWDANSYTLTANANGGSIPSTSGWSGTGTKSTKSVDYDSSYGALPTPTRTGYTFDGWYDASSGGNKVTSSTKMTTLGETIYAHWTANGYTLTANANGGSIPSTSGWSGTGTTSTKTVKYNSQYGILPTPTRIGYTFDNWWTSGSGGNRVYTTTAMNSTSGATIYAHWTPNIYKITLDKQSGSGGTDEIYLKYNTAWCSDRNGTITITSITKPTRTGYTFGGYYTDENGAGTQIINASGSITGSKTYIASADTLYAKWTANTYSIVFDKNGGSGSMSNQSMTYDKASNLTTNTYTRQGYYFVGWSKTKLGVQSTIPTSNIYKDEASVTNLTATDKGTVTLYAVWLDTWANHGTTPTKGDGTESSPYIIDSAEKLAYIIKNYKSSFYKQTVAIDLSKYYWYPIGTSTNKFKGNYNGQGNEINNMNIPEITNAGGSRIQSNLGLFGYTEGNVKISGIYLKNATVYGKDNVGLIASNISGTTEISSNIIESSKIYASGNYGAITGVATSGTSIKYNLVYVTTSGGTSTNGLYTGSTTLSTNLVENNGTRSKVGTEDLTGWGKVFNRLLPSAISWGAQVFPVTTADFTNWVNKTIN